MHRLPQPYSNIYALSLPRGHAFGGPAAGSEAWQSDDALAWGAVTRDVNDQTFGILVMRSPRGSRLGHGSPRARVLRTHGCPNGIVESSMKEGRAAPEPNSVEHGAASGIA